MICLLPSLPKLTDPSVYIVWTIRVKSCLALITEPETSLSALSMLTASSLPSTTDAKEKACRARLEAHAMAVLNFTLPDYFLLHGKTTAEALWLHLRETVGTSPLAMVVADFQRTLNFRINEDDDPTVQIEELAGLYMKLEMNNCNVPPAVRVMTLLSAIPQSWDHIRDSLFSSHPTPATLTWDVVRVAIIRQHAFQAMKMVSTVKHASTL